MHYGPICLYLSLWALVATPCAGAQDRVVPASDPLFRYSGAWLTNTASLYTLYPGSEFRFRLKGKASLVLRAGQPGAIRVVVRRNTEVVWDDRPAEQPVAVDGGTNTVPFSVTYCCTSAKAYDPATESRGAELHFERLELCEGAELEPTADSRETALVDFIGDSITAGVAIHGREGAWSTVSDASLTYGYLLAEALGIRYRLRAFPGARCQDLAARFAFFQKGVPLPPAESPQLVFVNIGANNRGDDAAEYRGEMRRLLEVILLTYPRTRVVLLNFMRMTPNRLPTLKELARSYPDGAARR